MKEHTLRVHVPAALGRQLIAPSLPRFLHAHPRLRVQMRDGSSMGDVPARDVDVAICIGLIRDPNLVAHQIAMVGLVTCASPDLIERDGSPSLPADLAPTSCIAVLERGTGRAQDWVFCRGAARYTLSPAAPLAFSDVDSAVASAVRAGGYVRVHAIAALQRIAAGLLEPVLEEWNEESQPVTIVHAQDCPAREEIAMFVAFVTGLFPAARAPSAVDPVLLR
jgi:LysR family transcriptional regulator for bpeEF and oprC